MNLLFSFPGIEFITVPEDAENIESIYQIRKLKELEITAKKLELLDLSRFSYLEYLIVHDYLRERNSLINCKQLKHLCIIHSNIVNLKTIPMNSKLETLHLEFCYNLKTLDGIQSFGQLTKFVLDYCLKMGNISDIKSFANSLKYFRVIDCNKIQELSYILSELVELENLHISTSQTNCINKLHSVSFVEKLTKLKSFVTDYKNEDGDLKPLLKIESVDILKFYKHYNLQINSFRFGTYNV